MPVYEDKASTNPKFSSFKIVHPLLNHLHPLRFIASNLHTSESSSDKCRCLAFNSLLVLHGCHCIKYHSLQRGVEFARISSSLNASVSGRPASIILAFSANVLARWTGQPAAPCFLFSTHSVIHLAFFDWYRASHVCLHTTSRVFRHIEEESTTERLNKGRHFEASQMDRPGSLAEGQSLYSDW